MSPTPIPAQFNDGRRRFIDRLTRRVVMACGLAILLVMLLLFVWLIWVVVPLFASPAISSSQTIALSQTRPAIAMGMDAGQQWGWRIDNHGEGSFIPLAGQPSSAPLTLVGSITDAAITPDNRSILLNSAAGMLLVEPDFHGTEPRWKFPLGDRPLAAPALRSAPLSLARPDAQKWLVAQANPERITVQQFQLSRSPLSFSVNASGVTQLLLTPDGRLLFALSANTLRVWRITPEGLSLRDTHTLTQSPKTMGLLSGGSSLLIADEKGIAQWFDIATETGPHLRQIRYFTGSSGGPQLFSEAHRRVFATLSEAGALSLFASKQQGAIFSHQLAPGVLNAVFAPRGDGLLVERQGHWEHLGLANPWPDISWQSLWQKVWYEHYPAPDYVWQSTSANDDYQGKFSLVPVVVGTLKAAALAMLFATPLALAAAMYTAWFMAPGLRRWVKPAIEMMGALPSVVIGLIAGLWLAPQLADRLLGVLLLPLALAGVLLFCGWASQRLPPIWRRRLCAEGREIWLLLPLLLLVALFCLWLLPSIEHLLFSERLADRLGDYQQRNLLIAGVAMGFALVPLIFTLAEDAIFSVPASLGQGSLALGATPWQTLTRVVLPGASAGIFAALMIGFGRALGETMIVLMATGNTPVTEGGLFEGVRSLAANVAIEMPEAAAGSGHYRVLFLSALVLLIFTLIVNTLAELIRQRLRRRYGQQEGQG
ncbi:ABC transporter permease subunit [Erwinia sp. P6884]|uniref:ABC transporter permease subunit n=1 Tax=Erwinia sp. P6884 TaxID=3141450 RepID=UPI0031881585